MTAASDSIEAKFDRGVARLENTSIWRVNYDPPLYRALRAIGFNIPPPHLTSFPLNAVLTGLWFGLLWGTIMWVFFWGPQGTPVEAALVSTLTIGGVFGVVMASYYAISRRTHQLPLWDDV